MKGASGVGMTPISATVAACFCQLPVMGKTAHILERLEENLLRVKDRITKAYDMVAEFYDEYMEQTGHIQAQKKMADIIRQEVKGRVLDVATGTGAMANYLGATGVDISEAMIREAKGKNPAGQFYVANVEHLPFCDGAFTTVISCLGILWFPDKVTALSEMKRVCTDKLIIVEEEGTPARMRIDIPEHLKPFFQEIEELESPAAIDQLEQILGLEVEEKARVDIDGSHQFVAYQVTIKQASHCQGETQSRRASQ